MSSSPTPDSLCYSQLRLTDQSNQFTDCGNIVELNLRQSPSDVRLRLNSPVLHFAPSAISFSL